MDPAVQAAFVAGGLLVGLLGVHVERPAVMLVGFAPGAFLGATYAPRFIEGVEEPMLTVAIGVVAVVAGAVGAKLAWTAWMLVHAIPGFVAGVAASAPLLGVSLSNPELDAALATSVAVGLVGAVLAWKIHYVFVAAFTGAIGSVLVTIAVLGENVYVPMGRVVLRNPEAELRMVVESARDLGMPAVGLAVVFAVVQLASLRWKADAE
ncbi:MAG: DUF4203 domain-containing protein [Halobacterium sp.]